MSDGQGASATAPAAAGMVLRMRTWDGWSPHAEFEFKEREVSIEGSRFSMRAEFPTHWSDTASAVCASKYFRRRGVLSPDGGERSILQVSGRISRAISGAARRAGLVDDAGESALSDELASNMLGQRCVFNSPVWFNCGLYEFYGIAGGSGGSWAWDAGSGRAVETENSYGRPQCSACFILSVGDSLDEIFGLAAKEARIFKYGSGSGVSVRSIRGAGEPLSGGGVSSGTMSWLKLWDAGAGGVKSGGTTRRAATMRVMPDDHPEFEAFIKWKALEEDKIVALVAAGYSNGLDGEAQATVGGQNSNNSVRLSDAFMRAVIDGGEWQTRRVTDGAVAGSYAARDLWRMIVEAAHRCADPGVQFDTTINSWNTVPNSGRINATNPCAEFVFLDNTACNLASINLAKFYDGSAFDVSRFRHAVSTTIVAMEALVDYSSYPTREIAERSHRFRPLGLGYANLGALLMRMGVPYDSDRGRAVAAAITSLMCAEAYATSARMASAVGPFDGFGENREPMLSVVRRHAAASSSVDRSLAGPEIFDAAASAWADAVRLGESFGYRNSQVTVLAPTGTISLVMDCDTSGVEPDFSLVRFKTLVGGGVLRQVNGSVRDGLLALGYSEQACSRVVSWVSGSCSFQGAPFVNVEFLSARGLNSSDIAEAEQRLRSCRSLEHALSPRSLGAECVDRLGLSGHVAPSGSWEVGFELLAHWGLTRGEIDQATDHVLGRSTVEGCPDVRPEHLAVFDCANRGGRGSRYIQPRGHLRMLCAVAPFLSGSASKTINLPKDATVEDISDVYMEAWRGGVKCVSVYRDQCKSAQPLSSSPSASPAGRQPDAVRSIMDRTEPSSLGAVASSLADSLYAINAAARAHLGQPHRQREDYVAAYAAHAVRSPSARAVRRRLPKKRGGFTQEARIGGHKIFLRTGEYADGTLGEIFIDVSKAGAATRSLMNCFAIAVSLGLQHGVPVAEFVDAFSFARFEPSGVVQGDENGIRMATSVADYVARVIGVHYQGRTDLAHVPQEAAAAHDDLDSPPPSPQAPFEPTAQPSPVAESDQCGNCGGVTTRTGRCMTCQTCGTPSGGCS